MRARHLLEQAISLKPETVLDIGVGKGDHATAFISTGSTLVVGVDVMDSPIDHPSYKHYQNSYEELELEEGQEFDLVWTSHTLEHIPNAQHFLSHLYKWLKPDSWLCIAVPTDLQQRLHIGHLSLWTPAHLAYNLVCAGWDCKEAIWYTDYLTIGFMVQKKEVIDLSWRTSLPNEINKLQEFMPIPIRHNDGAWWGNNWPKEIESQRVSDPPLVTIGVERTNLPPKVQLTYGPNPNLRKGYERRQAK